MIYGLQIIRILWFLLSHDSVTPGCTGGVGGNSIEIR